MAGNSGSFSPSPLSLVPSHRLANLVAFTCEAQRAKHQNELDDLLFDALPALLDCDAAGMFFLSGPDNRTLAWSDNIKGEHTHRGSPSLAALIATWQKPRWFVDVTNDPGFCAVAEGTLAPTVETMLGVPFKLDQTLLTGSVLVVNKRFPDAEARRSVGPKIRKSRPKSLGTKLHAVPPAGLRTSTSIPNRSNRRVSARGARLESEYSPSSRNMSLNHSPSEIQQSSKRPMKKGMRRYQSYNDLPEGGSGLCGDGYEELRDFFHNEVLPDVGSPSSADDAAMAALGSFTPDDQAIFLAAVECYGVALDRVRVAKHKAQVPRSIGSWNGGRRAGSPPVSPSGPPPRPASSSANRSRAGKRTPDPPTLSTSRPKAARTAPATPPSSVSAWRADPLEQSISPRQAQTIDLTVSEEEKKMLLSFDMRPWELGKDRLVALAAHMFDHLGLLPVLNVPKTKLAVLLQRILEHYNDNLYHNDVHAFDVAHCVFLFIEKGNMLNSHLLPLDAVTLLLAAFLHDVDHRGFTNGYHVASNSPFSMVYGTASVMEKHHISMSVAILSSPDCNVLSGLTPEERESVWSALIKNILATDVSNKDDEHLVQDLIEKKVFTAQLPMHRRVLMRQLMRAADISNAIKPTDIAVRWANTIVSEFFLQGDKEREQGLPVSNLCDRNTTQLPDVQVGFIKFLARPTIMRLVALVPQLSFLEGMIDNNLAYWTGQQDGVKFMTSLNTKQRSNIRRVFDQLDTDKSGSICVDELKVFMQHMSSLSTGEVQQLMKQLDLRGENELSEEEFCRGAGPFILSLSLWPQDPMQREGDG